MSTLERAIAIAAVAHEGQQDGGGAPYILHSSAPHAERKYTVDERIVAVLHDTVENGGWSLQRLRQEGFSDAVIIALDSLTPHIDESFDALIDRAVANPIARKVKLADLVDNLNLNRLTKVTEHDLDRLKEYRRGHQFTSRFNGRRRLTCPVTFEPSHAFRNASILRSHGHARLFKTFHRQRRRTSRNNHYLFRSRSRVHLQLQLVSPPYDVPENSVSSASEVNDFPFQLVMRSPLSSPARYSGVPRIAPVVISTPLWS